MGKSRLLGKKHHLTESVSNDHLLKFTLELALGPLFLKSKGVPEFSVIKDRVGIA
jgi:hypothetical protein